MRGYGSVRSMVAVLGVASIAICGQARADDAPVPSTEQAPAPTGWQPTLGGSIYVMIQRDKASSNAVAYKSYSDTYGDATLKAGLALTPELSIRTTLDLAPVTSALSSRYFKGEGAYIGEANLKYESGDFLAYVGKFDPSFSLAGRLAPGLYGTDFAGDYTLYGEIGAGTSYQVKTNELGTHALGGGVFMADSTFLSVSAINGSKYGSLAASRSERTHGFYGGAGNTDLPQSLYFTYDGYAPAALPGLKYQLAFSSLANGAQGVQHQNTYVGGIQYYYQINDEWSLTPLAEWARIDHVGGSIRSSYTAVPEMQDARYKTVGLSLGYGNWTLSGVRSIRDTTEPQDASGPIGTNNTDHEVTASLNYYFDWGLGLGVGWKHAYAYDYNTSVKGEMDKIGLQASYYKTF